MSETYCPASMCLLIAPDGSPWTGQKNAVCPQEGPDFDKGTGCAWYMDGGCAGCSGAHSQVAEAADGVFSVVIGPVRPKRGHKVAPKDYDCARSAECQWQIEAEKEGGICPPRTALRLGVDPRFCLF